jgi:hypothetical protein
MNNYKKEQINIDTVCKYSNDGIFNVLKNYIDYEEKIYDDDGNEVNLHHRLLVVCSIMRHLTDEKLLNHTLDVLRKFDLINEIENTGIDLSSHSENEVTKIKAIYYSLTSLYNLNIKALKFPNSKNPKQLNVKLKENRVIEHNLQEALNSIQLNNVFQFEDEINNLPINSQKRAIDKWVRSALKVDYLNDTEIFKEEIEYLKGISNHLLEFEVHKQEEAFKPDEVLKNPDKTIFKDDFAFTLFDKMKGYYSDTNTPQADYSFLFDIMQKEGFVICTGVKFIEYLSKFDIPMTKIDSSKTGNKRKTKLYNATKENLQKSTV